MNKSRADDGRGQWLDHSLLVEMQNCDAIGHFLKTKLNTLFLYDPVIELLGIY